MIKYDNNNSNNSNYYDYNYGTAANDEMVMMHVISEIDLLYNIMYLLYKGLI